MIHTLSTLILSTVTSESWKASRAGDAPEKRYPFMIAVRREWLMTPRENLDGGIRGNGTNQEEMIVADWAPLVDIYGTDQEYVIRAELPEVKKEDFKIAINDDRLVLHGERRAEKEEQDKQFHRIERSYGSFARGFALPDDVDVDQNQGQVE